VLERIELIKRFSKVLIDFVDLNEDFELSFAAYDLLKSYSLLEMSDAMTLFVI